MALDDFLDDDGLNAPAAPAQALAPAPAQPKKAASAGNEDEDLFDFPVIEMKLEADAERKPAIAPPSPAPAVATPAPAPAPAPAKPAPAPAAPAPLATKPAPAKEQAKAAEKDVAKAAQLVEDIEQVLGSDGKPRKRQLQLQGPSGTTLLGIGLLLLTNLGGLLFLWHSTQSFQSGVNAMNDKLTHALQVQALGVTQTPPDSGHETRTAQQQGAPLASFEYTALELARAEIKDGEFGAARKRLARLLATADRIEAEQREEIEAQASFLLAKSYEQQAEAARGRTP